MHLPRSPTFSGKLAPKALKQHATALVAKLDDASSDVQEAAVRTLGSLEPRDLAHHAVCSTGPTTLD